MEETPIGKIAHYWPEAKAAEIRLARGPIRIGDTIRIRGHGHEFTQLIRSIQIEHKDVKAARAGEAAAIGVPWPVHEGDEIFIVRNEGR